MALVDRLLDRAHELLQDEGRVGLILPCYAFQTAGRVVRYSSDWSLQQQMIPRSIYPGLSKPLMFAIFRKDRRRMMIGLSLYHEAAFVQALPDDLQEALIEGPVTWGGLVIGAITAAGGEAALADIYDYVCARRPTANPHWKEQVRKICQARARRTGRGRYAVAEVA